MLVDEADSILIDEARTPLIVSSMPDEVAKARMQLYQWSSDVCDQFVNQEHYNTDPKTKQVTLTAGGRRLARKIPQPDLLRETPTMDIPSMRRQKTKDFVVESLASPATEEALLGATAGMLFKMVFGLDETIEEVLKDSDDRRDHIEAQTRGTDAILRLTRQVDRFVALRQVLAARRQDLALPKPR